MISYKNLIYNILDNGTMEYTDALVNGEKIKALTIWGAQWRHNMVEGFPLLTTKKMHWKGVITELEWFLRGETNIKWLQDKGIEIWTPWADSNGDLGPIYGYQWIKWGDQIRSLITTLKSKPLPNRARRRMVISAWNVVELPLMKLLPCHYSFQVGIVNNQLNLIVNMRSCDSFLGLPFNIASYAILLSWFGQLANYPLGELVFSFGDLHIYENHLDQIKKQIKLDCYPLPYLRWNKIKYPFEASDISLIGYKSHPSISASIAI